MANADLSVEEWAALYQYLLTELEKRGFNEIRAEIETAASEPAAEEGTPEEQARISGLVRGEVGKATIRRRSPEEVFAAAVGVLRSRLEELPVLAAILSKSLALPPDRIEFRFDYEQRYALKPSDLVRLDHLLVNEQELHDIRDAFSVLGVSNNQEGTTWLR